MSAFSIVCAVEAGRLERQTLLMLETLRRFGGRLAGARAVAFHGRRGPPLAPDTLRRLEALEVEYVRRPDLNRAPWFNYANKIAAVRFAETAFATERCIWLDSDVLIVGEPRFAAAGALDGVDFAARFAPAGLVVAEDEPRFERFWTEICRVCGVSFDDCGFHDCDLPPKRMKPYFNSGVMVWRRGCGFAERYADDFHRVLDSRLAPAGVGPWFADQIAITPALLNLGLRWRPLEIEDNLMLFRHYLDHEPFLARVPEARVIHYSKSRNGGTRAAFDAIVSSAFPETEALLREDAAAAPPDAARPTDRVRRTVRQARMKLYERRCRSI